MIRDSANVVLSLQRATHRVLQLLDAAAKEVGVSPVEMNMLANLQTGELWTVSQLGRASGLRPSTATGVLDRLEERGLLERRPNPADRRSATVALTPGGEAVARSLLAAMRSVDEQICRNAPDASLIGYHEVIGAVTALSPVVESSGASNAR
jgi:DNA-binding MarR family transcriptional regulator